MLLESHVSSKFMSFFFFYFVIDYPADLSLFYWERCVEGKFAGYSVSEWLTVNMVSNQSFGRAGKKHFNSLPQQNITEASVRTISFILIKLIFIAFSHSSCNWAGHLRRTYLSVNCSNMWSLKTTRVPQTRILNILQLFKIRKGSVVVWPLDFLTCLFMKLLSLLWNFSVGIVYLVFKLYNGGCCIKSSQELSKLSVINK